MMLHKPRTSNFKLGNNRRQVFYECLMADLNLMGIVNNAKYEKYTGHEKCMLLREPEGTAPVPPTPPPIPPIVPGTVVPVSVDLNAIDENAIKALIAGKETWRITVTGSIYNSAAASKNLKKLVALLASQKQAGNKVVFELNVNAVGGKLKIPASCFTPLKDVLTEINFPTNGAVSEIGAAAFEGCAYLQVLQLNATTIGQRAFAGCFRLLDVHISRDVQSIGKGVLKECTNLTRVVFEHPAYLVDGVEVDMSANNGNNAYNFITAWVDKDIVRKD